MKQSPSETTRSQQSVSFAIYTKPVAKGRARAARTRRGGIKHYTPERTRHFEAKVAERAAIAMIGRPVMTGPIHMEITFWFDPPKSWTKRERQEAHEGATHHLVKPDLSNLQKAIEDAMNKIVYLDDSQIVSAMTRKVYGRAPKIQVDVTGL